MRRPRPSWRIPLALALVALPLAGLSLLAADRAGDQPSDHAAVVQRLTAPGTTDAARLTDAARALGLLAVLLAAAGVAVLATRGRAVPATVRAGRPARSRRATGRGPPLLPR